MLTLRRRLMALGQINIDVRALEFSYTGTWTDSEMTISGNKYRVLQLMSAGTLTIDSRMVGVLPFDVWCVRQGATGNPGPSSPMGTAYTTTFQHFGCGGTVTKTWYSAYGAAGANGGWTITQGVISNTETLNASVGSPAYLGDLASVYGTNRVGSAWFSLPSGNTGAGGSGGSAPSTNVCGSCGETWTTGATNGSSGSPGIVVIRIPIKE